MTTALRYLLDTNVLSELLRDPRGAIAQRIETVGEDSICTSIIVASEMRFGARKRGSLRLAEHVEALLSAIPVLPFAAPADKHYAHIRAELERAGTPIGPNDMLIAAQALALGLVVVTANYGEFSRVRDLRVENWLL